MSLDSLSNLVTVNGYLYLRNNDSLADLNGLVNVNRVFGTLHVIYNYRLADCRGLAPLLGYPNGNDSVSLGIYIYGNSQGCNSSNDILLAFESDAKITEAYIGLLGRAPDPAGLEYWSDELLALVARGQNVDIALKKLTNDITLTPEWIGGGGSGGSSGQSAAEAVVSAMYINLFSRQATAADLAYWSAELTNRRVTESEMVVLLIQGAQSNANTDSQVLEFKRQAASFIIEVPRHALVGHLQLRPYGTFMTRTLCGIPRGQLTAFRAASRNGLSRFCSIDARLSRLSPPPRSKSTCALCD